VVFKEQGRAKEALEAFSEALKLDGRSRLAINNYRDLIIHSPSLWKVQKTDFGSFAYPQMWQIVNQDGRIVLISDDRRFQIEIEFEVLSEPIGQYLARQADSSLGLISEEYTKIAGFDRAYVRVWKDREIHKVQFFLFVRGKVVLILAYPSESSLKPVIDGIISTIEIK